MENYWRVIPNWMFAAALLLAMILVGIQMIRGDALVCSDGSVFKKTCPPHEPGDSALSLPTGTVIALDDPKGCSKDDGWHPFGDPGQSIVAGRDGTPFPFRDTGGTSEHRLTMAEMPSHGHEIEPYGWGLVLDGDGHRRRVDVDDGHLDVGDGQPTDGTLRAATIGGGKPHNNMPPYIALHLCRKQ